MPTKLEDVDKIFSDAYKTLGVDEDSVFDDKGYISTGSVALDYHLGGYGIPCGRTAEFYGPSQSGKTTAAISAGVQVQRKGGLVVYLDYEQALDLPYMHAMGLNTDDHSLFRAFPAASLEDGMELSTRVARTGLAKLIIHDSVPAMTPRSTADGNDEASRMLAAERARLLGVYLGRLNPILAQSGTALLLINHIMDVINTGFAPPGAPKTTTPGGKGIKYYSSTRVKFQISKTVKSDKYDHITGEMIPTPYAVLTRAEVTKSKTSVPGGKADIYLELGKGFDNAYSALSILVAAKMVTKAGAFYTFPEDLYHPQMMSAVGDKGKLQGLNAVLALAEHDPEWGGRFISTAVAALPGRELEMERPDLDVALSEDTEVSEDTEAPDSSEEEVVVPTLAPVSTRRGRQLPFTDTNLPRLIP